LTRIAITAPLCRNEENSVFSVYGLSGPIYQGTFEGLKEVAGVYRGTAVRPIDQDEPPPVFSVPAAQAVSAYREMLRSDPERGPLYHAYQIMQRQIVSVTSTDAVERAWRILLERRIHQAPVLDPTYRLVGIVSERDLLTVLNVEEGRVRDVLARAGERRHDDAGGQRRPDHRHPANRLGDARTPG
jgi:acetoin utilization protein AcuB